MGVGLGVGAAVSAGVSVALRGCQRRLLGDDHFLVETAMTTPRLALSVLVVMNHIQASPVGPCCAEDG